MIYATIVIRSYCYRLACGGRVSYIDCKRNVILYCLFFQSSNHTNCNVEALFVYRIHACQVMQPLVVCFLQPDFSPLFAPYFFLPTAESVIFQFILCLYTFCRVCLMLSAWSTDVMANHLRSDLVLTPVSWTT